MKKSHIYLISIVAIIISLCFYINFKITSTIKVEEAIIENAKIPSSFDGIRLIQFGDLHIKEDKQLNLLQEAINEINRLEADIILFNGDLFAPNSVTSSLSDQTIEILNQIKPSLAKIAVLGDADLTQAEDIQHILTASDFKVLRNDSIKLYNGTSEGINFIGIDSLSTSPNLTQLLSQHSHDNLFNILVLHEPSLAAKATDYPISLQLSGHCRGDNSVTGCSQFYNGTYPFADQLILQVNPGLNPSHHLTTRPTLQSFLLLKRER